jgi:hypothetical protein
MSTDITIEQKKQIEAIDERIKTIKKKNPIDPEIAKLQAQKISIMYPDDEEEYDEKYEKDNKEDMNDDIKYCNDTVDSEGNKLSGDIVMIVQPNSIIIECYNRSTINRILDPSEDRRLYKWNKGPIKSESIYALPSGTYIDNSAIILNIVKLSKLVLLGNMPIGSDIETYGAVSSLHGASYPIYKIVPLDPVKFFNDYPKLKEMMNIQSLKISDNAYQEAKQESENISKTEAKIKEEIDKIEDQILDIRFQQLKNKFRKYLGPDIKTVSDVRQFLRDKTDYGEFNKLDKQIRTEFEALNNINTLSNVINDISSFLSQAERATVIEDNRFPNPESAVVIVRDNKGNIKVFRPTRSDIISIPEVLNTTFLNSNNLIVTKRVNGKVIASDNYFISIKLDNLKRELSLLNLRRANNKIKREPFEQMIKNDREIRLIEVNKVIQGYEISMKDYMIGYLRDLLKIDHSFRYEGVTSDLISSDKIRKPINITRFNTELPIMTFGDKWDVYESSFIYADVIKKCNRRVNENILKSIFSQSNMIIAGGFVVSCMYKELTPIKDMDVFFYGITEEKAIQMIDNVMKTANHTLNFISIQKTKNAITIKTRDIDIQFILRIYNTKSEILHGFDIGASAVGLDGTGLYFTTLSKFSHEFLVNVIDTSRRSTTYEYRLIKYMNKGFDILLPDLNEKLLINDCESIEPIMTAIDLQIMYKKQRRRVKKYIYDIKYSDENRKKFLQNELIEVQNSMENTYNELRRARSLIDTFESITWPMFPLPIKSIVPSDILEDPTMIIHRMCRTDTVSDYKSSSGIYHNIFNIINKNYNELSYYSKKIPKNGIYSTQSITDILNNSIQNFVKKLIKALFNSYIDMYNNFCTRPKYNEITLFKYRLIIPDYESAINLARNGNIYSKEMINLLKSNYQKVVNILMDFSSKEAPKINWVTKNQMTQLTSSFNPIIKDPKDWYGAYYLQRL